MSKGGKGGSGGGGGQSNGSGEDKARGQSSSRDSGGGKNFGARGNTTLGGDSGGNTTRSGGGGSNVTVSGRETRTRGGYTSLRDRFDGGGPGRSGDRFEGGPFSELGNALGGPRGLVAGGIGSLIGGLALGPIGGLIGGFAGRQIGRNMGQQGPRDPNAGPRMNNINFGDGGDGPDPEPEPAPAPAPAPVAPPPVMPIAAPAAPAPIAPTPVMPLYLTNAFGAGSYFDEMGNEVAMSPVEFNPPPLPPLQFNEGGDVRPGFFGALAGLGGDGERRGLFGGLGSLFGMGAGPDGPDPDRLAALREALDAGEISQDTYETMYARLLMDTDQGNPGMGLLDLSEYIMQAGQPQAPTQLSTNISRGSSGSGTKALSRLGIQPLA